MARAAAVVAACCAAVALALALTSSQGARRPAALALEQEGWQTEPGLYDFGDGNVGMGPVYYGDTRLYGAVGQGREGQEQPWPKYEQYRGSDVNAAKAHISKNWEEGYVKDFQSYFPKSMRSGIEIPDPVTAGYWPFLTQDGVLAQGDPGGTGKALREWTIEEAKSDDPVPIKAATAREKMSTYLTEEEDETGYPNMMRYWTSPTEEWVDEEAPKPLKGQG
ncbi:hypothetical protein T484DRAFT_1988276, partial [Baffinella frigidus]